MLHQGGAKLDTLSNVYCSTQNLILFWLFIPHAFQKPSSLHMAVLMILELAKVKKTGVSLSGWHSMKG